MAQDGINVEEEFINQLTTSFDTAVQIYHYRLLLIQCHVVCSGSCVNIGPLAPAACPQPTSPKRDRSPSEWIQAVSIHLQMNSALFHQQTPPFLPQPITTSSSLLLALFSYFCLFPPGSLFPASLPLSFSFFLVPPVMKSAITLTQSVHGPPLNM